ncbi:MAG: TonB-dependent receptor [Gammaproteobacteria bacterium]|jgi:outer membrane receptor protein involved in Fe transport|nr:TonB-dependent receptor [Gammaproteobacteria bacterium]
MRWTIKNAGLAKSVLWLATACILLPASGWTAPKIDEITVTARKQEESLQEVPLSIAAFGEKQLRERNIDNAYDVADFTPNFNMARNLGRRLDRPIIRGMFPPGRGRATASFFVDDVFLPGEFGSISTSSLDNVERVEVLRGPQAALFGRATFAGAVNYITRDIKDVWEGEVNARAGADVDRKLSVWASGPLIKDVLKIYVGGGYEGWDGEWHNDLHEGQANASTDGPFGGNTSLDFFNGPGIWRVNVPDIAGGEAPCPDNYRKFNPTVADRGCPPQRADKSHLGGEQLRNATVKLEFTPTDNLEFNLKAEWAETEDDHFATMLYETVFDPVNGTQLAQGQNCKPPIYDPDLPQTLPDGTVLDGTYIPSFGWHCGELSFDESRAQINIPSFEGVATCPPGRDFECVERDGMGNIILDANGNIIPTHVSKPAPFLGAQTRSRRLLAEAIYTHEDWEFQTRLTQGHYDEDNVRDLERSYSLGPITTGLFEGYSKDRSDNESFEIRASSPRDGRWRGLLGYYYYKQEVRGEQRRFNSFSDGYLWSFSRNGDEINHAVFGSIEFDASDTISLTFDARYAEDEIIQRTSPELCADKGFCETKVTFYSFTPRFIVDYHPNDDLNFYASVAKGNNPGGFNREWFDDNTSVAILQAALGSNCDPSTAPDPNTAGWLPTICGTGFYDEAEAWTWEIGAKTSLMDGRLIANGALFYIDWTNQAINRNQCIPREDITNADGPNAACEENLGTVNAGESRIWGVELDLQYAATDNLTLGLAYGMADTKLEDYFDDDLARFNCNWWEFSQASGSLLSRPLPDCEAQDPNNAAGNESALVPKHTLNLSAVYRRGFRGDMEWFVKNYLNYESKKYVTVANLATLSSFWMWNASAGLESDRWEVSAYVNNILDDDTPTIAFDFPLFDYSKVPSITPPSVFPLGLVNNQGGLVVPQVFLLTPRRGRNAGITMRYRFGG